MTDDEGGELSAGVRPALLEEGRQQGKLQQHAGIGYEIVQNLNVPVLQMVEQLPNVLRFFLTRWPVGSEQVWNFAVHEQVVDVPKIAQDRTWQHLVDHLRQTQTAEELVEVPTPVSDSSFQGIVDQNADSPVPSGRGGRAGLHDLHPGQVSTAFAGADHVESRFRVLEVLKVFSRDRLPLFHPRTRLVLRMRLFYWGFALFPFF